MMKFLNKLFDWYFTKNTLPYWCVLLFDCAIVLLSGLVMRYVFVGGSVFAGTFWPTIFGLVVVVLCYVVSFRAFRIYGGFLRFSSFKDLQKIALSNLLGAGITLVVCTAIDLLVTSEDVILVPNIPQQLLILAASTFLMWVERLAAKSLYDSVRSSIANDATLIYGIGDGAVSLAKGIRGLSTVRYDLKGFIAPEGSEKIPGNLLSYPIYKDDDDLLRIIKLKKITYVLVSPYQTDKFRSRTSLVDALIAADVKIYMEAPIEAWDGKSTPSFESLHEVDIEDLLPRKKIEINLEGIAELIKGKAVLITGAAGSIGSEMSRQVAKFDPARLILVDQAETPMHDLRLYMAEHFPNLKCDTIVADISNPPRMEEIFSEALPAYVFHAAAYKHVPMMEDNPCEAVQNNVFGTRVIADLAVKYGTRKFVMVSTDKAVNPTNVMGCSKRISEIYCQALSRAVEKGEVLCGDGSKAVTQFITTRFGNVLGSNGSVIPLFRKQIREGGPVTVTHPDIIRFFMLISEACRLVLEAGTMGKGGEIFIFDMGKPVRIAALAQKMIDLSGAKNVKIEYTGLRDGEKLYEEVLSEMEGALPTTHPMIKVAAAREYDYALARTNEEELLNISLTFDDMATVAKMKQIVPEYKSRHSKWEKLDK